MLFTACEEEKWLYESVDPFDIDGEIQVLVGRATQSIVVDAAVAETSFEVSAKIYGPVSSSDISVPFVVDSTNLTDEAYSLSADAIVIEAGKTSGSLTVTLYSAEMFPGEIFNLYYSFGTPSTGSVYELGRTGVITTYNPGLLGPWIGAYSVHAASYGLPGDWDEAWGEVVTELDPNAPLDNILIYGIASASVPLVATIDIEALTITIGAGQSIGDVYGYGNTGVLLGDTDLNVYPGEPLVGTVDAETGEILVDFWGHQLLEGDYAGYVWDVFNCTFTKGGKAANYVSSNKKPVKNQ